MKPLLYFPLVFLFCINISSFSQNPKWIVYDIYNSQIQNNFLTYINIDRFGNKWIGTHNDKGQGSFVKFDDINWIIYDLSILEFASYSIQCIEIDDSDNKWISFWSQGIVKFDGKNWFPYNKSNSELPEDHVYCISIDADDNIWMGTAGEGLVKFDGINWTIYNTSNSEIPSNYVQHIEIDNYDNKWIMTWSGLAKLDVGDTSWAVYDTTNSGLVGHDFDDIAIDSYNNKWILSRSSDYIVLIKFDDIKWTVYYDDITSFSTWPDNILTIDKTGDKWIGLVADTSNALKKFDGMNWTSYDTTNSGWQINEVNCIKVDEYNNKWIGTSNGLLVLNEGGVVSVETKTNNPDSGLIAYYPFNGNANDISDFEHHGEGKGATLTSDRFGNENSAYFFDGIDDVIAIEDSLYKGDCITISAWFKKLGNGTDVYSAIVAGDCSTPYLGFNRNSPTFGGQCDSPMPHQYCDYELIDTNWHHIVGVYYGYNISLYIDNTRLINNYVGNFTFENSIPIGIGGSYQYWRDSESFFGVIDEVRIYDRPLNRVEISSLFGPVTNIYENNKIMVVNNYKLHQNYPNPFNPSTTIKYSIPKQSKVTIKVFDVLGSEVTTLVHKVQQQGNYELEFDGSELTSGIYFYRLRAGEYLETKKMILLK